MKRLCCCGNFCFVPVCGTEVRPSRRGDVMHKIVASLFAAILLATIAGCGSSTSVTGKVTFAGRAVVNGTVIFAAADKTAHSTVIEPDGTYTMEGLLPGAFRIAVISRDPSKGRSILRTRKPDAPSNPGTMSKVAPMHGWFPLPVKWESPTTSGLSCTLGAGRTTHDIELK